MSYNRAKENRNKKNQYPKIQPCPFPEKCKPNCPGAIKDANYCPIRQSCPSQTSKPPCKECLKAKEEFTSNFTRSIHQMKTFSPCDPCRKSFEAEDSPPSTYITGQTVSRCDPTPTCSGPLVINAPDSCYPQTNLRIELHIHQIPPKLNDIQGGVNNGLSQILRPVSDANETDTIVASRVSGADNTFAAASARSLKSEIGTKPSSFGNPAERNGVDNIFTVGSARTLKSVSGTKVTSVVNPANGAGIDNTFMVGSPRSLKVTSGTKAFSVENPANRDGTNNTFFAGSARSLRAASGTKASSVRNPSNGGEKDNTFMVGSPRTLKSTSEANSRFVGNPENGGGIDNNYMVRSSESHKPGTAITATSVGNPGNGGRTDITSMAGSARSHSNEAELKEIEESVTVEKANVLNSAPLGTTRSGPKPQTGPRGTCSNNEAVKRGLPADDSGTLCTYDAVLKEIEDSIIVERANVLNSAPSEINRSGPKSLKESRGTPSQKGAERSGLSTNDSGTTYSYNEVLKEIDEGITRDRAFVLMSSGVHKKGPGSTTQAASKDSAPSTHEKDPTYLQYDATNESSGPIVVNAPIDSGNKHTDLRIELFIHQLPPQLDAQGASNGNTTKDTQLVQRRGTKEANEMDSLFQAKRIENNRASIEIPRNVGGTDINSMSASAKSNKTASEKIYIPLETPGAGGKTDNTSTVGSNNRSVSDRPADGSGRQSNSHAVVESTVVKKFVAPLGSEGKMLGSKSMTETNEISGTEYLPGERKVSRGSQSE